MSINLRFAMDTWGVTYQAMVPGMTTSFLLAKEFASSLRLMFEDLASVHQVACCSVNDRGLYNLYVKFDFAPEPLLATKVLSRACIELNGLHFQVYDPLNYMAYVKLPFEMNESQLDNGLRLVRENTPKITARVSEGIDVVVETL